MWYADGLEKALEENNHDKWLINYFENDKETICFGGCQSIVVTDKFNNSQYYTIEINGNNDLDMSFIVQDENLENLAFLNVNNDFSDVKEVFNEALNIIQEFIEEDIAN